MNLEETTQLYASVLRQLLPTGGYDTSPNTEALAVDVYAHAKLLAQADLDAKRLLNVLEGIPSELMNEYEAEYGLPLKCTVNTSRTFEERLQILNWVRTSRNVLNRAYLEQILSIFGVVLIDVVKFKPLLCTAACDSPVNTEQLRYKVFLRLQYPMNADMNCIVENYLPGYLRVEWMIDMPWGDWILNPAVTVNTNGIAHYTAYKTNQREYYDSYANLDLTEAIVRSLHDENMQQWQAVKDAITELIGAKLSYTWDIINQRISYLTVITPDISLTSKNIYSVTELAKGYARLDACRLQGKQLGTGNGAITVTSSAGIYMCNVKRYTYIDAGQTYTFDWAGQITTESNPKYDASAVITNVTQYVEFITIAQKILSNSVSANQIIALLAEVFLEAVAKSVFNSDKSKQFVKLSNLISQFEPNKTLRT